METGLYGHYWTEALGQDRELGDHQQGQPDRRDLLLRVGRPDDGRPRRLGQQRLLPAQRRRRVLARAHGGAATPSATPTCPGPPRSRRPGWRQVVGLSRVLKVQVTGWTSGHTPSQLTATSITGAEGRAGLRHLRAVPDAPSASRRRGWAASPPTDPSDERPPEGVTPGRR